MIIKQMKIYVIGFLVLFIVCISTGCANKGQFVNMDIKESENIIMDNSFDIEESNDSNVNIIGDKEDDIKEDDNKENNIEDETKSDCIKESVDDISVVNTAENEVDSKGISAYSVTISNVSKDDMSKSITVNIFDSWMPFMTNPYLWYYVENDSYKLSIECAEFSSLEDYKQKLLKTAGDVWEIKESPDVFSITDTQYDYVIYAEYGDDRIVHFIMLDDHNLAWHVELGYTQNNDEFSRAMEQAKEMIFSVNKVETISNKPRFTIDTKDEATKIIIDTRKESDGFLIDEISLIVDGVRKNAISDIVGYYDNVIFNYDNSIATINYFGKKWRYFALLDIDSGQFIFNEPFYFTDLQSAYEDSDNKMDYEVNANAIITLSCKKIIDNDWVAIDYKVYDRNDYIQSGTFKYSISKKVFEDLKQEPPRIGG